MSLKPISVSFLTQTDENGASARLRVYAQLPYLAQQNIHATVFPAQAGRSSGHYLRLIKQRWTERHAIAQKSDVIIIQRDFINHMKPWLEEAYSRLGKPLIFDIDDAIDLRPPHYPPTWRSKILGCSNKIERLAAIASHMVMGNDFLAARVRPHNPQVTVLPTALDLSQYPKPTPRKRASSPTVIGWIGSPLTTPYLDLIHPALAKLAKKRAILFRSVGAAPLPWSDVPLDQRPWTKENEQSDVASFDIGVMPLSDDPWSRAKCGTKIIQYFAAGVPCVASPVGMNSMALNHGHAGILASTTEEWLDAFEKLIDQPQLYSEFSTQGRLQAEKHFDTAKQGLLWRQILDSVLENRKV